MELRSCKDGGSNSIVDIWGPFRGKYPDPTPHELHLIDQYLRNFKFEKAESKSFISLKNRLQSPNLRHLLLKFLRQVRGGKGYDVDMYFDFIDHPFTVFVPRSVDDEAMAAAKFAVGVINSRATMMAVGKSYEVVSVEKSVSATRRNVGTFSTLLLLTFTANRIIVASDADVDATATVVALQAMVQVCNDDGGFQLKEWKYKPIY